MTTETNNAQKITIDASDVASLRAALAAKITTPELLFGWLDDAQLIEGCLVLDPRKWLCWDDSGCDVEIEADTAEEAAQEYVDSGDWGPADETCWITVRVGIAAIDADGRDGAVEISRHKITIEADEPKCSHADGHDWQSPYSILGGLKENPGVWGHGGGATITEVCRHCGCARTTDTWAQDMTDGEQGLRSTSYEPRKYAAEVRRLHGDESDAG